MTALHPDHQRLLELARAALQARDNRQLWRQNTRKACEEHGYWCDELWKELERQTDDLHGEVAILEHPIMGQRRMLANLRREIVTAAMNGIEAALDELSEGPLMDEEA